MMIDTLVILIREFLLSFYFRTLLPHKNDHYYAVLFMFIARVLMWLENASNYFANCSLPVRSSNLSIFSLSDICRKYHVINGFCSIYQTWKCHTILFCITFSYDRVIICETEYTASVVLIYRQAIKLHPLRRKKIKAENEGILSSIFVVIVIIIST